MDLRENQRKKRSEMSPLEREIIEVGKNILEMKKDGYDGLDM
jgi:hypothetical protein